MKVYGLPTQLAYTTEYSNYSYEKEKAKEEQTLAALKTFMVEGGYDGPLTGEIVRFGVADGYAQYMFCDGGRKSCLIHLPFGDAWSYPYIERLTKKDILDNITSAKRMAALFGRA